MRKENHMRINRRATTHEFEKQNLVTLTDRIGTYDLYKCALCGLTGKQRDLGTVTVSDRNTSASEKCPKAATPRKVRIIEVRTGGKPWSNLTPGSVHQVVDAPKGMPDNLAGVWVMGVGEPVKILVGEYVEEADG
jgi:hypothetical protein